MAITMRWVGDSDRDRVAQTRLRCYSPAAKELERYRALVSSDVRQKPGDFLLAEDGSGGTVGTSTSLSLWMWIRGARVSCQGVAWVGTVKTHRRGSQAGIATALMRETLRQGREREQIVSALMPFRASFYEHFGYGTVERLHEWKVPLSVLPAGPSDGMQFYEPGDFNELSLCRQRFVQRGQCDVERTDERMTSVIASSDEGFLIVDRPTPSGPVRGYLSFQHANKEGKDLLRVTETVYEDVAALRRQLHFLAAQKDQFSAALLTLPPDLPFNWLLRETQIPHRPVNHPAAELRPITRMQVRILDHKRFLESLQVRTATRGRATVAVYETEGQASRFNIEIESGRVVFAVSASTPDFECDDRVWAAIACGELPASQAVQLGLAKAANSPAVAAFLDFLTEGPKPFCGEFF